MSTFKGRWEREALLVRCYSVPEVHGVSLFLRSLTEGVQLHPPPFVRKVLKLNTVSLAVSSCRVSEVNQNWKQAVGPCYLPVPVSGGRSDKVSGETLKLSLGPPSALS